MFHEKTGDRVFRPNRIVVIFQLVLLLALPQFVSLPVLAAPVQPERVTATSALAPVLLGIDDVGSGSLLLRTEQPSRYLPAPVVATEVNMRVSGMIARVELKQTFVNPSKSWLEGIYAFPLPENASIDRMRLTVGEVVTEAYIAEREAARQTYEAARREGRRAALVEQHRPNIFTNAVANIGPGESVTVEIRYQNILRYDQGRFHLRFPLVVAPRFQPAVLTVSGPAEDGWVTRNGPAPDANSLNGNATPPVLRPEEGAVNPVVINIALDAGFPLAALSSPHHAIKADDWSDGVATITLGEGAVPADRDFELVWTPETGSAPVAGVFSETANGETHILAMVLPPQQAETAAMPRDMIFVLDRSGSMAGTSIEQAKAAMAAALGRLRPVDRFNIIRFDDQHDALFPDVRPADFENLHRAKVYVQATEARGGTVMQPALRQALSGQPQPGRLRQIVFLTDGAVSNEDALMREIEGRLGGSRLFTVGIGSAPNSFFMRGAAEAGRGSFTHIGKLNQVAKRMGDLFAKLERPAMTDLATSWSLAGKSEATVESYPKLVPDLYHGEPLLIAVKLPNAATTEGKSVLELSGNLGGRLWRHVLPLKDAHAAEGVAALWGRSKIDALMLSLRRGADPVSVKAAVTETALRHSLVSQYTSLVAVQKKLARPGDTPLASRQVPLNLPSGWEYDKVFGKVLHKAPPPSRASGAGATQMASAQMLRLPQGATPWQLQVMVGLAGLMMAGAIVMWARRPSRSGV